MNIFSGFINWLKGRKDKPVEEVKPLDVGVDPSSPDYDAHVYLKEKFGYSRKQRKAIIYNFKKAGGKL